MKKFIINVQDWTLIKHEIHHIFLKGDIFIVSSDSDPIESIITNELYCQLTLHLWKKTLKVECEMRLN